MGDPTETRARFAILGDDLDPDAMTALMGCAPDKACRKGEVLRHRPDGQPQIARTGRWALHAKPALSGDLNAQILAIVARLPTDPDLWRGLAGRFKMNVFCGVFMGDGNVGCALSPEVLVACGNRGLPIDLDIYAPTVDEDAGEGV